MLQDGKRWKEPKVFYRNKLLGVNSEINYSQNQTPLLSESEITDKLQKEAWKFILISMGHVNDPPQGTDWVEKSLTFVHFPVFHQKKPSPKLLPAVPQTQFIAELVSLITNQVVCD